MSRSRDPFADPGALLRAFRAGNADASKQVRRRVGRIVRFRLFGIPREDRLDLEQRIVIELWQVTARPRFSSDNFWGFVEVVASRRCIDWLRSRESSPGLELPDEVVDSREEPLARTLRRERLGLAQAVLEQLPEPCRELIRLHTWRNMTFGEIAEVLGKSEGALRVQMHRCIKRARKILREMVPEEED